MVEVFALRIPDEIPEKMFERLLKCISMDKQKRIKQYKGKKDAVHTLFADLLTRYILMKNYGIDNREISFKYNSYNKPFLVCDKKIEFNVSHSGSWVVAAVGSQELVGIDIEKIQPIDVEVFKYVLSSDEYVGLLDKKGIERCLLFYELWTLKESYVKAMGYGLSVELNSFAIFRTAEGQYGIRQDHSPHSFFFQLYDIDPAYKFCVCTTTNTFPSSVDIIDIYMLYSKFSQC
ncbi:4'-phosphopantetheinyl transferase superfamily protein [Priestia flexa]|uniref:4'-phosphopantetheinyl transferase family protein n=1 Tax=Priestia flexa TaxID=86664 RepID=UPI000CB82A7A|nr:4'-phosphopantetheinyl transferase superfamily protein [Priestia flexa]MEC0665831.1 4'-phosphopantetheinyl transferase superfamily protein [Priestia flexa]